MTQGAGELDERDRAMPDFLWEIGKAKRMRDFRRKRNVVVRAGKRYLARARR